MDKPSQKQTRLQVGRTVSYFDFGDPNGFPILLHTGHLSSGILAVFIDDLAKKNQFRVISVNRPGIGDSDYYEYNLNSVAGDSKELMRVLGMKSYIIVSLSAGSAFLFALCQDNTHVCLAVALGTFAPYQKKEGEALGLEKLYFQSQDETLPKVFLSFFKWFPWIIDIFVNFFLDGLPKIDQREKMKQVFSWDRSLALANGMKPMLRERKVLISDWANLVSSSNQKIKYLFFHGELDKSAPVSILDWYTQSLNQTGVFFTKMKITSLH